MSGEGGKGREGEGGKRGMEGRTKRGQREGERRREGREGGKRDGGREGRAGDEAEGEGSSFCNENLCEKKKYFNDFCVRHVCCGSVLV